MALRRISSKIAKEKKDYVVEEVIGPSRIPELLGS